MNTIAQELKSFGFEHNSAIRLSHELGETSSGKLKSLFSHIWDDVNILSDNDRINRMIIRYTIMDAVKNNQDYITAEMIESAKLKADGLANLMGTYKIHEEESVEDEEGSESVSKGVKRTRNPDLYPRIKSLVTQSPDATKNEIVSRVVKELDTNEGTATMYFYKARKELGLKNNGKRGRKAKQIG